MEYANRRGCEQLGTTAPQMIGRRFAELGISEGAWGEWEQVAERAFATHQPGRFQFLQHAGGGRLVELRFTPDPTDPQALWVVAITLEKGRHFQDSLREEAGLFRGFLDRVPAVSWLRDDTGRYVFLNPAYETAFRVKAADRIGQMLEDVWPADTAAELRATDRMALDTGRDVRVLEIGPEPDGRRREWLNLKFPIVDENGKRYVGGISVDMTEQRAADERAARAAKLESLGLMAAGAAHDFNNLLTVILGHATMAGRSAPGGSPVVGHLREIEAAVERAGELCEQMLAFAGRRKSTPADVDLTAIARDTAHLARPLLPPAAALHLDLPPDPVVVHADPTHLRQVVLNLLTNAADAMTGRTGEVRVGVTPADGRAVLTVADQGAGMTADVAARVFEPFFTTKSHGHGLGLAAVHGIVRSLGGEIGVQSQLGVGTTFRVELTTA